MKGLAGDKFKTLSASDNEKISAVKDTFVNLITTNTNKAGVKRL